MREALQYWITEIHLTWRHLGWLIRRIRGLTRDRSGRWYWHLERENRPGHFEIRLLRFPGLTDLAFHRNHAGRADIGVRSDNDPSIWMLFNVQVTERYRERGLGTLLVRAAIRLARRRGAQELHGMVVLSDVKEHPFLPEWYARLGFAVQRLPEPDPPPLFTVGVTIATFWMDLTPGERHLASRDTQS